MFCLSFSSSYYFPSLYISPLYFHAYAYVCACIWDIIFKYFIIIFYNCVYFVLLTAVCKYKKIIRVFPKPQAKNWHPREKLYFFECVKIRRKTFLVILCLLCYKLLTIANKSYYYSWWYGSHQMALSQMSCWFFCLEEPVKIGLERYT